MKKKGFTLIELLAVIIILAIVALIATPKILDVIENARRSAFEQSARGYYKAAEYVYNEMFLDGDTQDINFTFKDGVQTSSNPEYKLEVSGEKPKGGLVYLFKDGRIMLSIHNNKYCANVDHEGKVNISEDINDCTSGITEIPSECFSITSETVDSVSYNMLDYDRTNPNCPLEIDTLIIPSEIDGQPVEGIGSYAFHHTRGKVSTNTQEVSVKNVIMPDSIKVINSYAFYRAGLVNTTIPTELERIGNQAFRDNQLTRIEIPSSIISLGSGAFRNNKITEVVYSAPNITTSYSAINNPFLSNKISHLTIEDNVTKIPNQLFSNQELTSVDIPSSVTTIGNFVFRGNQLTNVTIPNSVTSIGIGAFTNNQLPDGQAFIYARNSDGTIDTTNLVSYGGAKKDNIVIPNGVTTIGSYAFSSSQITSVTLPSGVIEIGTSAFSTNQLTSITIPSSVTTIGSYAFKTNNFADASAITIEGDATRFDSNWTTIGFPEDITLVEPFLSQYKTGNTVGLVKDGKNYYYKGTNDQVTNNYVLFGGHLWRVLSIDEDNNLTMITQQSITSMQPASSVWTTQAQYESSYVNRWLNSETDGAFLKSLSQGDKDKILNSTFNVGIYTNVSEITTTQKVGLLDERQYTKAGGQTSFLAIKDNWWLGNRYGSSVIRYVSDDGYLGAIGVVYEYGVRPVIKVSNLTFTGGEGTAEHPFTLE